MQDKKGAEINIAHKRGKRNKASQPALALDAAKEGCQLTFVDEGEASQYLKDIKRELLYLFGFTPIPPPILCGPHYAKKTMPTGEQRRMRDIHRSTLIILRMYAYGKDYCFPSNRTLSRILNKKQDYMYKILRHLDTDFSLISRNERFNEDGSQTSNITKLKRLDKGWVEDFNNKLSEVAGKTTKVKEFHSEHEDQQSTYDSVGIDNLILIHYAGALNPSAFITLCLLIVLHKKRIYYFSGYDLANIRGVSKSKVYRDLEEIEETGLVEMIDNKSGTGRTILHKYPSLELILEYCKQDIKYIQALSRILEDIPGHVLDQIFGSVSVDEIVNGLISANTCDFTLPVPNSATPPEEKLAPVPNSATPTSCIPTEGVPNSATPPSRRLVPVPDSATHLSQIVPPLNNRYIEECIDNNVIGKKDDAPQMRIDNGIKNPKTKKRGRVNFKKDIPEEAVGEIKEFVETEICAFLDDHGSLNNYVFLAELCYDNGADYCQVIWRAKSLFKYERTEGKIKDERRYFNALLRKVMADEYKIDIPRIGKG